MAQVNFPLSISAILLDLDGTLLHSAPELTEAANRMLRDLGYPSAPQELLMSYIGNGISWLVKRALTGSLRHGEAEPSSAGGGCGRHSRTSRSPCHAADMYAEPDAALFERALPIFEKHYSQLLLHSKPYDGVIAGLDAMRAAGYRLGCITNKSARFTGPLLKSSGLAEYFGIVLSGDSLPQKKPSPLPLLHAAQFLGVPVQQVLFIGDSRNDTIAARAAGCPVFCVPYGYNHGKPVGELDLDAVIEDLSAALKLIKRA